MSTDNNTDNNNKKTIHEYDPAAFETASEVPEVIVLKPEDLVRGNSETASPERGMIPSAAPEHDEAAAGLSPAQISDLLSGLPEEKLAELVSGLPASELADLISDLSTTAQDPIIKESSPAEPAELIPGLSPADQESLLSGSSPAEPAELIPGLSPAEQEALLSGLSPAEPADHSAGKQADNVADLSVEGDTDSSSDNNSDNKNGKKNRKKKAKKSGKKSGKKKEGRGILSFIVVAVELLALITLFTYLPQVVSLNRNDPLFHKDTAVADEISCNDGELIINNITVKVPTKPNVDYSISYSWAEDDTDYPSVPHAVQAAYSDDEGVTKYDLSLYKDSEYSKKELPDGKNSGNWFDDWNETDSDGVRQSRRNTNDLRGFYISSLESAGDEESDSEIYATYTYYFAVRTPDKGVAVYVLEGICYDPDYTDKLESVMTGCINKIKVSKVSAKNKSST